jgi:hypothetical protein
MVWGQKSEVRGANLNCGVWSMAHRDVLEPQQIETRVDLEDTVLAHKTAPLGLFALQDDVLLISKIRVYDGVLVMQTLEVVR